MLVPDDVPVGPALLTEFVWEGQVGWCGACVGPVLRRVFTVEFPGVVEYSAASVQVCACDAEEWLAAAEEEQEDEG